MLSTRRGSDGPADLREGDRGEGDVDSPRGDNDDGKLTFEVAPPGGANDRMMQCLIVRDRSGLKRMNPEYLLYLQDGELS